jgi:hypothetical protein
MISELLRAMEAGQATSIQGICATTCYQTGACAHPKGRTSPPFKTSRSASPPIHWPSQEEKMPPDAITIAGYTVTSFQLVCLGAFLLGVAALLLAFALERRTAIRRSDVTDNFTIELARIAQALDRIADQGSYRIVRRAAEDAARASNAAPIEAKEPQPLAVQEPPPPPPPERRIACSIFGH